MILSHQTICVWVLAAKWPQRGHCVNQRELLTLSELQVLYIELGVMIPAPHGGCEG